MPSLSRVGRHIPEGDGLSADLSSSPASKSPRREDRSLQPDLPPIGGDLRAADRLLTPGELKLCTPLPEKLEVKIVEQRRVISDIVHGRDPRLLVICGPCSVDVVDPILDYAHRLRCLSAEVGDVLYVVMRAYLEKPRTAVGWKGFIDDPHLDGTCCVEDGLRMARKLLTELAEIGLPLAGELLGLHVPDYLGDLFSWFSVGARTVESQVHREVASGLPAPVGFKNGTDGNWMKAVNAVLVAARPHRFVGIGQGGELRLRQSSGNENCHVVLRGGDVPNYCSPPLRSCCREMRRAGVRTSLLVDCSHANSGRDHRLQPMVARHVLEELRFDDHPVAGVMLESYIQGGSQARRDQGRIGYGLSVTDPCMGWGDTVQLLRWMRRRHARSSKYLR